MMAEKTIDELWQDFDRNEDEKEYVDLERSNPLRAERIERLVNVGISPKKISERYLRLHPHRWPESKAILAAARYLAAQLER